MQKCRHEKHYRETFRERSVLDVVSVNQTIRGKQRIKGVCAVMIFGVACLVAGKFSLKQFFYKEIITIQLVEIFEGIVVRENPFHLCNDCFRGGISYKLRQLHGVHCVQSRNLLKGEYAKRGVCVNGNYRAIIAANIASSCTAGKENIAMASPDANMERIIQVARIAGAHEFISEMPMGYDTYVEERGSSLSGGQKQRIAIARALITNPNILIFDEATSSLDYESERIIHKNLGLIRKGRTVIFIAHRLSVMRECDVVIVIDRGKIVETGNHEILMKQGGLYSHLYRQQEETSP
jgi:ABC-type Na+ transport system ATPase subunit NatA